MDLQSWVYTIAIIYMLFWIFFMASLIFIMYKIYVEIKNAPQKVEGKIASFFSSNKVEVLSMVAMPVATFLLSKIKDKVMGKRG